MANRNFNQKQALEREVKDVYARFTSGSTGGGGGESGDALFHFDGDFDDSAGVLSGILYNNQTSLPIDPSGKFSDCIYASNGAISRIEFDPISLLDDFTLEAWVYPILSEDSGTANGFSQFYEIGVGPVTSFFISRTQTDINVELNGTVYTVNDVFTYDTWHHLAISRSGDLWNIYVDGDRVISETAVMTLTNIDGIGLSQVGGTTLYVSAGFGGKIDEVRFTLEALYTTSTFPVPTEPFGGSPSPAAQPVLVSDVGIKSVVLQDVGLYEVTLEDKYASLKHAKAVLVSSTPQDVKFMVEEDAVAEDAVIMLQAVDSSNNPVQPDEESEILLKLELKNSSVEK